MIISTLPAFRFGISSWKGSRTMRRWVSKAPAPTGSGTGPEPGGPAPRGMDRFAHRVDDGSLIVDTSKVVLGPLPVALGQPGLIPPKSPTGCI